MYQGCDILWKWKRSKKRKVDSNLTPKELNLLLWPSGLIDSNQSWNRSKKSLTWGPHGKIGKSVSPRRGWIADAGELQRRSLDNNERTAGCSTTAAITNTQMHFSWKRSWKRQFCVQKTIMLQLAEQNLAIHYTTVGPVTADFWTPKLWLCALSNFIQCYTMLVVRFSPSCTVFFTIVMF